MSELRENIHKNDFLMDRVTKQLYFVVSIDLHNVIIREEKDGDEAFLKKMPKHMINKVMIKVNPNVMKVLYGDKKGNITTDDIPDLPASPSGE
jgi:hypothetical protein